MQEDEQPMLISCGALSWHKSSSPASLIIIHSDGFAQTPPTKSV